MIRSIKILIATVIVVWVWIIIAVLMILALWFAIYNAVDGEGWISVLLLFAGVPVLIGLIAIGNTLLDWRRDVREGWAWGKR